MQKTKQNISQAKEVRRFLSKRTDEDVLRIAYCYQIGITFTAVSLMEDAIINSMTVCNKINVDNFLEEDAEAWRLLISKLDTLQKSTLGTLIKILSRHNIATDDLNYLRWVKAKRDFFVHRHFRNNDWPGDLDQERFHSHKRKLLYLQAIFERASHRIWQIFVRANLLNVTDLGDDGFLMENTDCWDNLFKD
jgi:hypothetical protein